LREIDIVVQICEEKRPAKEHVEQHDTEGPNVVRWVGNKLIFREWIAHTRQPVFRSDEFRRRRKCAILQSGRLTDQNGSIKVDQLPRAAKLHGIDDFEVAVDSSTGLMQVQEPGTQLHQDITRDENRSRIVSFPSEGIMHDSVGKGPVSLLKDDAVREFGIVGELQVRMGFEDRSHVLHGARSASIQLLHLTVESI
jgi:hypothetical protein